MLQVLQQLDGEGCKRVADVLQELPLDSVYVVNQADSFGTEVQMMRGCCVALLCACFESVCRGPSTKTCHRGANYVWLLCGSAVCMLCLCSGQARIYVAVCVLVLEQINHPSCLGTAALNVYAMLRCTPQ